jgi:hypothetical protein
MDQQEEVWDDSMLINAFEQGIQSYRVSFSLLFFLCRVPRNLRKVILINLLTHKLQRRSSKFDRNNSASTLGGDFGNIC